MSETNKYFDKIKEKAKKFKKKAKGIFSMKRKRESQQNVNSEVTEDSSKIQVETGTSSKLQSNQIVNDIEEIKQENKNIEPEEPDNKKQKKNQEKDSGYGETEILKVLEQREVEINKSNEKYNKLNEKYNKLNEKYDELNNTNIKLEQICKQHEDDKKQLEEDKNILKSLNDNYEADYETNADNIGSLQKKLEETEAELKKKEDEFNELENKNTQLRKEASKYQSALGNATNIRLGDEESVKFRQDILDLHKLLESYVTNLKPNMDIDFEKVQALAQKYGCSTPVDKNHKPFIKALLQRKALDDILEFSEDPVNKGEDVKLELDIETKTRELLSLIENFSASRSGTDETAKVASIKVRQQVYGILGNRGFADVVDSNGSHMHDFITYVSNNLNNTMNQYRKIKDPNKKKEVESIASKLIQDIYKLFFYLLNVQEPRVEYKFCETGSKIDPNVMKGNWDEDDVPQLSVDICSFPMIGRDLDSPNWKIYSHAKVYPYDPSKTS